MEYSKITFGESKIEHILPCVVDISEEMVYDDVLDVRRISILFKKPLDIHHIEFLTILEQNMEGIFVNNIHIITGDMVLTFKTAIVYLRTLEDLIIIDIECQANESSYSTIEERMLSGKTKNKKVQSADTVTN